MKTEIYTQYAGGVVVAQNSKERGQLPLPSYTPMPSAEPAGETEFVDASTKTNALGEPVNTSADAPNTAGSQTNLLGVPSDASAPAAAGAPAGATGDDAPKTDAAADAPKADATADAPKADATADAPKTAAKATK